VPGLIKMGVAPMSAHFFAFYFAVMSAVTPPIALAALAGAGLAGADYMKTSMMAFKIAIAGFIIPYLVVYNPVMVLEPKSWVSAVCAMIAIPLGMTSLAAVLFNCGLLKFRFQDRMLALASALMMLGYVLFSQNEENHFEYPLLIAGVVLFGVLLASQIKRKQAAARAADAATADNGSSPLTEVGR
jgi:TRAP-type uncharacterized transport system fused permease subunit